MRWIVIVLVFLAVVLVAVPIVFRTSKHPEKYASFVRNLYGDEVNLYNARSLWKVWWWPILLGHDELYKD